MSLREGFLYFFESEEKPNYYIIMQHGIEGGEDWYNRFNRIGRYDETEKKKKGVRFGYPDVRVKMPVGVSVKPEQVTWQFEGYVKDNYVKAYIEAIDEPLGSWGWYIIDNLEPEKWLLEFYDLRKRQIEKAAVAENTGRQISLF